MRGLCGMFEGGRRWLDAAVTLDPLRMRYERRRRIAIVRELLQPARIAVDNWEGASFILQGPTGEVEIVDNLFDLWRKAELLGHHALDPLAEHFPESEDDQIATCAEPLPNVMPDTLLPWAQAPSDHPSSPDAGTSTRRIPVHVLIGFLGSGKTTCSTACCASRYCLTARC